MKRMCALTFEIWTCKTCGWQGSHCKDYRFTFQVMPDGEIQGPFQYLFDLVGAAKMLGILNDTIKITQHAKCPECDSWETTKEDVPAKEI